METTAEVVQFGPGKGGKNPVIVVRHGADPWPRCLNPQCERRWICKRHVMHCKDTSRATLAVIPWYECDHFEEIDEMQDMMQDIMAVATEPSAMRP